MKKKMLWIATLFAALALIVTGCPTGGGDEPPPIIPGGPGGEDDFYLAATEGGTAVANNQITLTANGNVYVYFTPVGAPFEKIKITFNVNPGQNMTHTALYDKYTPPGGGEEVSHTWGLTTFSNDTTWRGGTDDVTVELDPSWYTSKWSEGAQNSRQGIDLAKTFGVCVNFNDINPGVRVVYKLKNVELTGVDYKFLLNTSITAAEALVEEDYTETSWALLQVSLAAAKEVYNKQNATQSEINLAKGALDAAIHALVPAGEVDKTALDALIATAETKDEDLYTPGSWATFATALAAAKEASESINMGQTAIDEAKDALQAAMDALALRIYPTNFIYIDTTATTSTVEIDTTKSNAGVTYSSGSINVPGVTTTTLYLKIDPAIDITSYSGITFDWSGHNNSSFNISLDMSTGRRVLQNNASGTATTYDFTDDLATWATGWGDADVGSLSGIEVYSDTPVQLTISKITIGGEGVVPEHPPADDGLTPANDVTLADILIGATGSITNSNISQVYSAYSFVKVDGTTPALRLKPAEPTETKGDFRVEITFSPAVDITTHPNFSFAWSASGGDLAATTNSYNVNFNFDDGGKFGKYSWMSGGSYAYAISAADIQGGTSTSLTSIEIWADKNVNITNLYIPYIKFEEGEPPEPPVTMTPVVVFDGSASGFVTGASVKSSSFVTATANSISIEWNSNDGTNDDGPVGAYRSEIILTGTAQADLSGGYSKFKMDWDITGGDGSWVGGNFNITLKFSGNRLLSAYKGAGTAEFNFVSDLPGWATGWGDAAVGTITGVEIYSTDNSGKAPIVITKIWFE